ncbi:hypothetical protein J3U57_11425 [Gilliamella sp. B3464]|uniref:hypothetical protein n=1 Tax=unclassified Gilliamella TaxID=2685620 RepID=UPI00226A924E|nr:MULTISPECIES: hypothetical protein [unclassified Gilliamella]MCX8713050.1 hypothetical protein [Gilliamella sp. B3468]MCX8752178.1 hypothetical protein [Gilliamella sp. B3464]
MFFTQTQVSGPLSKLTLTSIPWLLLLYATTTQALSATTAQVIHGSAPYLTFDNGVTKVTTTEGLLGITVSDGTTQTTYTPDNNTSTADNPIVLPEANEHFSDIGMLVPATVNAIALNDLIGEPYNYWGDDDGDGQGTNGITATGNLSVIITDKLNRAVTHSANIDSCMAPYKVELTSTDGSLTTQYGVPNSGNFSGSTAAYYITRPKSAPKICYAWPGRGGPVYSKPSDIWNRQRGFVKQAAEPSQYKLNFPTTGANNLYFDLDIEGIDSSTLTWPTVTQGGITATMTPSPTNPNFIRVTLTGPAATKALQDSALPGSVAPASLPQTFVIEGKDSRNKTVLSYGFELKQWFVARPLGVGDVTVDSASSWCSSLGGGYRLPQVKDLTNAVNRRWGWGPSWTPATPPSSDNYADANIGAGFLSEWGNVHFYISSIFAGSTAIAIGDDSTLFIVFFDVGAVHNYSSSRNDLVCVYP